MRSSSIRSGRLKRHGEGWIADRVDVLGGRPVAPRERTRAAQDYGPDRNNSTSRCSGASAGRDSASKSTGSRVPPPPSRRHRVDSQQPRRAPARDATSRRAMAASATSGRLQATKQTIAEARPIAAPSRIPGGTNVNVTRPTNPRGSTIDGFPVPGSATSAPRLLDHPSEKFWLRTTVAAGSRLSTATRTVTWFGEARLSNMRTGPSP